MSPPGNSPDLTGVALVVVIAMTGVTLFLDDDAYLGAAVVGIPTMLALVHVQFVRPWLARRREGQPPEG